MSRKLLQTKKSALSYSISNSATTLQLDNLLKLDGTSISASDIGDLMYFTIDPGTTKEEICSTTSSDVTVNADGTITIVAVRGLKEIDPYTTGGFSDFHGTGAVVVFGNNPQVYNQFAWLANPNSFSALNIFSVAPQVTVDPVAGNDMVRLSYVQALVLGTLTTIDVIVPGTAGTTIAAGQSIYYDDPTNRWLLTDASTASKCQNVLLGIAQGAGTAGNPISSGVLLQGVDPHQTGLVEGTAYYLSNTPGAIATSAGTFSVTAGLGGQAATKLYFAPRFNQQVTQAQIDALAGTSGTPSSSNKYVTDADTTATPTANKVARFDSNGELGTSKIISNFTAYETILDRAPLCAYYFQADGGVLFDAKQVSTANAGASSVSFTVGNNANRTLVVFLSTAGGSDFGSGVVQYGGVTMTRQQTKTGGSFQRHSVYTLIAPATGANNLTFTTDGAGSGAEISFYSYYNTNQSAIDNSLATTASSQAITAVIQGTLEVTGVAAASAPTGGANMLSNQQTTSGKSVFHFLTGDSGQIVGLLGATVSATGGTDIMSVGLAPATVPSFAYAAKTSASTTTNTAQANKYVTFVGFAQAGATVGQTLSVQNAGIVTGLTSLTPMATYYLADASGTISTTPGTNSKKIGIAISTTTLLIKHDNS